MSRRFSAINRPRGRAHWMIVEIFIWSGVASVSLVGLGAITIGLLLAAMSLRGG